MTAPRHRSARIAGAFALALALASCTNSSEPSPSPTSADATPEASADLGPVEALQLETIGVVDDEAWARVEHVRFEEAVAVCMRDAGFEYTPEEYESDEEDENTESLEYAREFGYGITTWDEDSDDEDYERTPNDLYIEGLSDEELDAYWIAYEGEYLDEDDEIDLSDFDDEDGEIDLGDLEIGEDGEIDFGDEFIEDDLDEFEEFDEFDDLGYEGCQGVAYEGLADNPLPYDFPEHQDVLMALDEMYAEVANDESLIEAEEAWSACMDEAGYPDLVTADDASYLVYDAYDAAWEEVPDDADDISEDLLASLQELELAVAVADFECRDSSGLTTAYTDVQFAAEQEFVDANRDALVAFFEDMGAALEA